MRKDRKGIQILDGFRHSSPRRPPTHVNGQSRPDREERASPAYCLEPYKEDLVRSLRAMEHRLRSLLEDHSHTGHDLHDCLLQSLYTIGSTIQTAGLLDLGHTAETLRSRTDVSGQINQLICEIRQMIHGLDEGLMGEFDLTAELHALKSIYDEIGHVQITLDLQPAAIEVLTKEEEREILSIVRETLGNCVRHTRATHATISIRRRGATIQLHISENGTGFAPGSGRSRGYGLSSISTRARKIGGVLRVRSEKDRGTQLTIEFALESMLLPV